MDVIDVNEQLVSKYSLWFSELRERAPILLSKNYSNPYYISAPKEWFKAEAPRIMIVGEEGFGLYGCGKTGTSGNSDKPRCSPEDFAEIQALNDCYLRSQLGQSDKCEKNRSPFWNRFRRISAYGVCCRTNIDKIHRLSDSHCALSKEERILLHSTSTRILNEEIALLNPTHIVFFGWYGISLRHELPALFSKLYPRGIKDTSIWKNRKIVQINSEKYKSLFLYHPAWGARNKWYETEADKALAAFFK